MIRDEFRLTAPVWRSCGSAQKSCGVAGNFPALARFPHKPVPAAASGTSSSITCAVRQHHACGAARSGAPRSCRDAKSSVAPLDPQPRLAHGQADRQSQRSHRIIPPLGISTSAPPTMERKRSRRSRRKAFVRPTGSLPFPLGLFQEPRRPENSSSVCMAHRSSRHGIQVNAPSGGPAAGNPCSTRPVFGGS
jgi:hypothetical protein